MQGAVWDERVNQVRRKNQFMEPRKVFCFGQIWKPRPVGSGKAQKQARGLIFKVEEEGMAGHTAHRLEKASIMMSRNGGEAETAL